MKSIAIAILFFLLASECLSSTYRFGASAFLSQISQTTTESNGKTSFIGKGSYFPLFFETKSVHESFTLVPRISYTLIPRNTGDGATKAYLFIASLPFENVWTETLTYTYGLSYLSTEQVGNGGSVTLNNGTGTTVFYRPNKSSTSRNLALTFGLQKNFPSWRLDIDTLLVAPMSTAASFHFNIGLSYLWSPSI